MRDVCGPQVADKVKQVWGLTEEGEVNSVWRDCGHEGLWFGVGTSSHSIAVQLYIFDVLSVEKVTWGCRASTVDISRCVSDCMSGYHIAERGCRNQGHRSRHLEEVGGQVLREER